MKTRTMRTEAEKKELIQKIDALVAGGLSREKAVKQVGIGIASYYAWAQGDMTRTKQKESAQKKTRKPRTQTTPSLLPLEQPTPQQVFVIYGKPDAVAATIARFM